MTIPKIRRAKELDLVSIIEIYNEAIEEGGFTADLKTFSIEEKKGWFAKANKEAYGVYVLILKDKVIGYFYFAPWQGGRPALKTNALISYYIASPYRGNGYGHFILENAIQIAKEKSFEHLLAILLDVNLRSKSLLEKHLFKQVGHLPNIAHLKDENCGQFIMMRLLDV